MVKIRSILFPIYRVGPAHTGFYSRYTLKLTLEVEVVCPCPRRVRVSVCHEPGLPVWCTRAICERYAQAVC